MKRFGELLAALDQTAGTTAKVAALATYFRDVPEADRMWTIALFSGRRPRRAISTTLLRQWAAEIAGIPDWLFAESYAVVGDLAETIALLLATDAGQGASPRGLADWIGAIRAMAAVPEAEKKAGITAAWAALPPQERLVFNKLLTGGFRAGIAQGLMVRALSQATGVAEPELAHRLMGDWSPDTVDFAGLILRPDPGAALSRPYPFYLASALDAGSQGSGTQVLGTQAPGTQAPGLQALVAQALGRPGDWLAEWKWDGIRGQFVLRGGQHFLWSRGEELVTARYPELAALADYLPQGTVIDGELLGWQGGSESGGVLPFSALQRRIGLKTAGRKVLAEVPVVLMGYDLLEYGGADLRERPLAERRAMLAGLVAGMPVDAPLHLSPALAFADWEALDALRLSARDVGAEGVMVKQLAAPYLAGRKRGAWWKWKLDPRVVDAVMIYAQAGHGRRANLYTDFTFAVWDGPALVPFAKAYSGLTDAEFAEITAWVRKNTRDRFGPVRQVTPELVFELAFEGIDASPRHKSGVAVRFPRMVRWRRDKPAAEAGTLAELRALLAGA